MRGRTLTLSLSILLAAGGVAACGDDGGGGASADAQPYVDALVESLLEDQDDEFGYDEDEAECIAEKAIDTIGVDTLEEEGITPEDVAASDGPDELVDLSSSQARRIAEAFPDCGVDFAALFAADAPEEARGCVEDNLDEDALIDAFALSLQGDDEAADAALSDIFGALQAECPELFG